MTAEESDKLIIDNWNKVVTKRDLVYVLGDITMENQNDIPKYISQLNGRIVLIGGNHDTKQCCDVYRKLGITVMGCLKYKGFICTHIPVHPYELEQEDRQLLRGNIHGHVHRSGEIDGISYTPKTDYGPLYYNVNIELHNYTPIAFDDLVADFQKKKDAHDQFGGGYKIQETLQKAKQTLLESYGEGIKRSFASTSEDQSTH
jgi:calcineurin-like phosphoesterase family protein